MSRAKQQMPDHIAVYLHWLTLKCRTIPISSEDKKEALHILESGYFNFKSYSLISTTLQFIATDKCLGGSNDLALDIVDALENNSSAKKLAGARHQLHLIRGMLLLSDGKYNAAVESFRKAQKERPYAESGLLQVSLLATAGQYRLALDHLDYIEKSIKHQYSDKELGNLDYAYEVQQLRKTITDDIERTTKNVY
jgi:tetratricopeptide (TPR) repeat protein